MDGTIGEVRLFAGNYAPRTWALCNGSTLQITSNQALYSILGVTFGGDGKTTFALPDLRGRTPVCVGKAASGTNYLPGVAFGTENVTLQVSQIPSHTHTADVGVSGGSGGGSAILLGINDAGGAPGPGGNFLGVDSNAGAASYAVSGTVDVMNSNSIVISNAVISNQSSVTIGDAGSSAAHSNLQPSLALTYIICIAGLYPTRN